MANSEQLEILKSGVAQWNAWRKANPHAEIDLSGANLIKAELENCNLTHADLSRANLSLAKLNKATLAFSNLERAILSFAQFREADLRAAHLKKVLADDSDFHRANLSRANLRKAGLGFANLSEANLSESKLEGANLGSANLVNTQVNGVHFDYGIFYDLLKETRCHPKYLKKHFTDFMLDSTMRCKGVNASGCFGSQKFKLFLQDQDFLEELLETKRGRRICLIWWLMANCGRSVARWAFWCLVLMLFYATVFYILGEAHFKAESLDLSFMSFVYYSGVAFTTVGFGDVIPQNSPVALFVLSETIMGYIMLGGLISIFNNKLARRGG